MGGRHGQPSLVPGRRANKAGGTQVDGPKVTVFRAGVEESVSGSVFLRMASGG